MGEFAPVIVVSTHNHERRDSRVRLTGHDNNLVLNPSNKQQLISIFVLKLQEFENKLTAQQNPQQPYESLEFPQMFQHPESLRRAAG